MVKEAPRTHVQMANTDNNIVSAATTVVPKKLRHENDMRKSDCGIAILQNDFVRAEISLTGGGVRSIALLRHTATRDSKDPWVFDDYDPRRDALTAVLRNDHDECSLAEMNFSIVENENNKLLLRSELPNGATIDRVYILGNEGNGDPYCFRHEIYLSGDNTAHWNNLDISLGSLPPTSGDIGGAHLGFAAYDGHKAHFTAISAFEASNGFFGFGRRDGRDCIVSARPAVWAAIKNQFFTAILTPNTTVNATSCSPITLKDSQYGIEGFATLPLFGNGDRRAVEFSYYVGPKEFLRLEKLGKDQERIMQFGWFGFVSKLLLFLMMGIHSVLPNWGIAIILLTISVKLLLWPLTSAQVRSTQAMAKLKEPMKAIQEKYKNNPQRSRIETMKLFRKHNVNPAAGCLPIFIQIPIFLGLYYMLRSAAELRFASFLWVRDLASADTVGNLFGIPINPLPLLMAVTTIIQVRVGSIGPVDGAQKFVVNAMPFVFLFVCYKFPAGLVLYWTAQNMFTIFQQYIIQRRLKLKIQDNEAVKKNRPRKDK
jgi:YidC/Oxa1 family membrane protein insertase